MKGHDHADRRAAHAAGRTLRAAGGDLRTILGHRREYARSQLTGSDYPCARMSGTLEVSVVVATRDRPRRLQALIDSLRSQDLNRDAFEVIVVDDGSAPETQELLRGQGVADGMSLRVIRHDRSAGPANSRNEGWRAANAPLIAFTDDDCVADPRWLSAGVAAAAQAPGAIVQGATRPREAELPGAGPFHRTLTAGGPGPYFETCNIFYPRALLDRLGGFDGASYSGACGEDTDLGWRALEDGAGAVYCEEARIEHAVDDIGPLGKLRTAARWTESVQCAARHHGFRQAHLWRRVFWRPSHYVLLRALASLALPKQLRLLRAIILVKYARYLIERAREDGGTAALAPFVLIHDAVETYSVVRGALRYRTLVI
jgi:GT2 family glycosyltransferase